MKIDDLHFVHVGASAYLTGTYNDYANGNPSTDIVSMENHNDAYFLIIKGAGAVGTATVTVGSCDTVVPGTATAIAYEYKACTSADTWGAWTAAETTGFTTAASADCLYLIHVKGSDLSGTNKFVRMTLTEVDGTAQNGAVVAILANPRYAPTPATVLA